MQATLANSYFVTGHRLGTALRPVHLGGIPETPERVQAKNSTTTVSAVVPFVTLHRAGIAKLREGITYCKGIKTAVQMLGGQPHPHVAVQMHGEQSEAQAAADDPEMLHAVGVGELLQGAAVHGLAAALAGVQQDAEYRSAVGYVDARRVLFGGEC